VSQQPVFSVFCFEGQNVPHPASNFLSDIKLSWRKSHYYQHGRVGSDKTVLSSSDSFVVQVLGFLLMYLHKIVSQNFSTPCYLDL